MGFQVMSQAPPAMLTASLVGVEEEEDEEDFISTVAGTQSTSTTRVCSLAQRPHQWTSLPRLASL